MRKFKQAKTAYAMFDYIEPYPTYDDILQMFMDDLHHRCDEADIFNRVEKDRQPGIRSALASLEADGFIKKDSHSGNIYILLSKGSSTFNSGGFRARLERDKMAADFKKQLDDATLAMTKSVSETNAAVQESFRYQKKFGNRSLLLGAISATFILVTIVLSILDKTPQRLQDIEKQVSSTAHKLDSIRLSLEKINSSMKDAVSDTLLVKRQK